MSRKRILSLLWLYLRLHTGNRFLSGVLTQENIRVFVSALLPILWLNCFWCTKRTDCFCRLLLWMKVGTAIVLPYFRLCLWRFQYSIWSIPIYNFSLWTVLHFRWFGIADFTIYYCTFWRWYDFLFRFFCFFLLFRSAVTTARDINLFLRLVSSKLNYSFLSFFFYLLDTLLFKLLELIRINLILHFYFKSIVFGKLRCIHWLRLLHCYEYSILILIINLLLDLILIVILLLFGFLMIELLFSFLFLLFQESTPTILRLGSIDILFLLLKLIVSWIIPF